MPDKPMPEGCEWCRAGWKRHVCIWHTPAESSGMYPPIKYCTDATAADALIKQQADRILGLEKALRQLACRCKCFTHGYGCGLEEATCKRDWDHPCPKCVALKGAGVEEGANAD